MTQYPARLLVSLLITVMCIRTAQAANPPTEASNPLYAMDTSVWSWQDRTPEQVIGMLKDLGYDGYGHSGAKNIPEYLEQCEQHGLRFFNTYVGLDLDQDQLDPALVEAARQLQGTGAMLWMPVTSERFDRAKHVNPLRTRRVACLKCRGG